MLVGRLVSRYETSGTSPDRRSATRIAARGRCGACWRAGTRVEVIEEVAVHIDENTCMLGEQV